MQTRSVHCVQQGRPSSSCLLRQKPPVLRACNTNFCPAPAKRGKGPRHAQVGFPPLWSICPTPAVFSYAAPAHTLGGAFHITVDVRSPSERCARYTHPGQSLMVVSSSWCQGWCEEALGKASQERALSQASCLRQVSLYQEE